MNLSKLHVKILEQTAREPLKVPVNHELSEIVPVNHEKCPWKIQKSARERKNLPVNFSKKCARERKNLPVNISEKVRFTGTFEVHV